MKHAKKQTTLAAVALASQSASFRARNPGLFADAGAPRVQAAKPAENILSQSMGRLDSDMTWEDQQKQRAVVAAIEPTKLLARYNKLGNIHKTGSEFGICGETARKILRTAGFKLDRADWTMLEIQQLKEAYASTDGLDLELVATKLGRTKAACALMAHWQGFSKPRGKQLTRKVVAARKREAITVKFSSLSKEEQHRIMSERAKKCIKDHGHPRGMLGKAHTAETKAIISAKNIGKKVPRDSVIAGMKTRLQKYGAIAPNIRIGLWRAGWRLIAGRRIYARSRWEANYARFLQFQKAAGLVIEWQHEPETFWFSGIRRGCCSYLPDFKVVYPNGRTEFHEVKGWMDPKSITKLKRMAKYHPAVVVRVIDGTWFKSQGRKMAAIVPDWEA